ncbi:MAG: pyridoxamine 5'-phosphate oxidase family protein [Oscillospiraceae bacterium]
MNKQVVKVLNEQLWSIGTYGAEPNVVPVAFKRVLEDGRLAVGDVFLETTLENIQRNGKIAISAFDAQTMEGYQVKGTAEYVTEGAVVDAFKQQVSAMFHGAATAKGALLITPEQVIVTTPGAENKKRL